MLLNINRLKKKIIKIIKIFSLGLLYLFIESLSSLNLTIQCLFLKKDILEFYPYFIILRILNI